MVDAPTTVQYEVKLRELLARRPHKLAWIYQPNLWNWGEIFGLSTNAEFEAALKQQLAQYKGKPLSQLPEKVTVTLTSSSSFPKAWEPFGTLIPGIPNPLIDPVTGQADPLGQLFGEGTALGSILGFLGFLFSVQGLAMIAGAILLYLGYKSMMGAGSTS